MGGKLDISSYFEDIVIIKEYTPYFCSIAQAISLLIVGTFCGFKNIMQIHEWAEVEQVQEKLKKYFGIQHIPCYYWLTQNHIWEKVTSFDAIHKQVKTVKLANALLHFKHDD